MKRIILFTLGCICLSLGLLGIVLPLLPTTPFLLIALWCFVRSSEKLYNFILSNKYTKPYVEDFLSGNGIPRRVKIRAITLIWLTIGSSVLFFVEQAFVRIMLLVTATLVSLYIGLYKEPSRELVEDDV